MYILMNIHMLFILYIHAGYPIIGVLGCMAERLKNDILDNSDADFIAGPDAYRNLPNLIKLVKFKKGQLLLS